MDKVKATVVVVEGRAACFTQWKVWRRRGQCCHFWCFNIRSDVL